MGFLEEEWWKVLWEQSDNVAPLRESPKDSNYQLTSTEAEVYRYKERIWIIAQHTGLEPEDVVCKLQRLGVQNFSDMKSEGFIFYKGVGLARTEDYEVA